MSKKKKLKERWEKVKVEYSILGEDYPKDLFDEMEKLKIEKPKAFEYRLKILERKEPELDVPLWTISEIHTGEDWDIEDWDIDEDD